MCVESVQSEGFPAQVDLGRSRIDEEYSRLQNMRELPKLGLGKGKATQLS